MIWHMRPRRRLTKEERNRLGLLFSIGLGVGSAVLLVGLLL